MLFVYAGFSNKYIKRIHCLRFVNNIKDSIFIYFGVIIYFKIHIIIIESKIKEYIYCKYNSNF